MMAAITDHFSIVSYNCHGFNQGKEGLSRICSDIVPEIIFIQEHWLSSLNNSELLTVHIIIRVILVLHWMTLLVMAY